MPSRSKRSIRYSDAAACARSFRALHDGAPRILVGARVFDGVAVAGVRADDARSCWAVVAGMVGVPPLRRPPGHGIRIATAGGRLVCRLRRRPPPPSRCPPCPPSPSSAGSSSGRWRRRRRRPPRAGPCPPPRSPRTAHLHACATNTSQYMHIDTISCSLCSPNHERQAGRSDGSSLAGCRICMASSSRQCLPYVEQARARALFRHLSQVICTLITILCWKRKICTRRCFS